LGGSGLRFWSVGCDLGFSGGGWPISGGSWVGGWPISSIYYFNMLYGII